MTLKGVKAQGNVQWKRENFYLYGAVDTAQSAVMRDSVESSKLCTKSLFPIP